MVPRKRWLAMSGCLVDEYSQHKAMSLEVKKSEMNGNLEDIQIILKLTPDVFGEHPTYISYMMLQQPIGGSIANICMGRCCHKHYCSKSC